MWEEVLTNGHKEIWKLVDMIPTLVVKMASQVKRVERYVCQTYLIMYFKWCSLLYLNYTSIESLLKSDF